MRLHSLTAFSVLVLSLASCSKKTDDNTQMKTQTEALPSVTSDKHHNADSTRMKSAEHGETGMIHGGEEKLDDMNKMMVERLGPSDKEYEDRFIDMMIPHHEGAILMAKDALKKSNRQELKKLAEEIIAAQNKEIKMMEEWRKKWYGH